MSVTTKYILVEKALCKNCGQQCVDWALQMLTQGHYDPSLCTLAGMQAPYNHFEISELRDQALLSLNIPDLSLNDALRFYAVEICNANLHDQIELVDALHNLAKLCIDYDYNTELYDFYLLNYAYMDLQTYNDQHYWNTTCDNFEDEVKNYFKSFVNRNNDDLML